MEKRMTSYVLETRDVAIHYGGVKALDGVSLTLGKGQILGLIGPNGAGKSTVIDAITGRRPLTRGQVILDGQDVSQLGAAVWGCRAAFSAPASLVACRCANRWN
jgi:branched-chain amino acid transport system ATP-binding protein